AAGDGRALHRLGAAHPARHGGADGRAAARQRGRVLRKALRERGGLPRVAGAPVQSDGSDAVTDSKALALEFLATLQRQDFDAWGEQLTEDATWTMMAPSIDPPALQGRDAIVEFFRA